MNAQSFKQVRTVLLCKISEKENILNIIHYEVTVIRKDQVTLSSGSMV